MQEIIFAYLGTVGVAIFYHTPPKKLFIVGVLGVIAWVVANFFETNYESRNIAVFMGAFSMGIVSEWMAVLTKSPSLVFSISGSIPLVPGYAAYQSAKFAIEDDFMQSAYFGATAIVRAVSIAFGVMLATGIFGFIHKKRKKKSYFPLKNASVKNSLTEKEFKRTSI